MFSFLTLCNDSIFKASFASFSSPHSSSNLPIHVRIDIKIRHVYNVVTAEAGSTIARFKVHGNHTPLIQALGGENIRFIVLLTVQMNTLGRKSAERKQLNTS
jgi:hypothetical protein